MCAMTTISSGYYQPKCFNMRCVNEKLYISYDGESIECKNRSHIIRFGDGEVKCPDPKSACALKKFYNMPVYKIPRRSTHYFMLTRTIIIICAATVGGTLILIAIIWFIIDCVRKKKEIDTSSSELGPSNASLVKELNREGYT